MQKEIHVLGPLLPSGYGIEAQNSEERSGVDIEAFLGEMQVQYGKRSVFFVRFFLFFCISTKLIFSQISFGTVFYPTVSEYVDELVEALIEKKAPFVSGIQYFMIQAYSIRFLLMHPPLPKFRSN